MSSMLLRLFNIPLVVWPMVPLSLCICYGILEQAMRFTISQIGTFSTQWKSFKRLTDDDLRSLETMLMDNPMIGAPMAGTGGLRKARFAPPSWHVGKSGALRVCYAVFPSKSHIALIYLFPKNEKANLTAAERNASAAFLTWYESTL